MKFRMSQYVEFTVSTRADRALAWRLFSNFRLWPQFSDSYGEIKWIAGAPWRKGSRLQIKILRPIQACVDHVITACSPANYVGWIDHALGDTMEQWVTFEAVPGGTRIHTWAEVIGPIAEVDGRPIRQVLKEFIEAWYSRFSAACDREHDREFVQIG